MAMLTSAARWPANPAWHRYIGCLARVVRASMPSTPASTSQWRGREARLEGHTVIQGGARMHPAAWGAHAAAEVAADLNATHAHDEYADSERKHIDEARPVRVRALPYACMSLLIPFAHLLLIIIIILHMIIALLIVAATASTG